MALRIAAIVTEYRPASHADVLVGKFLAGFPCDDGLHPPRVEVASLYLDQVPPHDTGVATAARHHVPLYPSIRAALTLGNEELAVDGVLIVGEHGDYALNERGQKLYPRRHLFEQVAGVLACSARRVPVFNDKHLSYDWLDARWMYERAHALGVPFMAGSSLPTCWRRPWLELPLGTPLAAALAIGYGGIESYGFHALETLQCMVERRRGGECGVRAVQCLEGETVWAWLAAEPTLARLAGAAGETLADLPAPWTQAQEHAKEAAAFLIEYADGLRAAVLMLEGYAHGFAFAGLTPQGVQVSAFVLQSGPPYAHFSYLGRNIEEMFLTGQPPYPVERTLLTTGILAAAMESRYLGGVRLATPHLAVRYVAPVVVPHRPNGPAPTGATLG